MTLAFFGLLVMWLVIPFAIRGNLAQDAIPFVVAGELARHDPDAIYAPEATSLYDLPPAFSSRSCELSPAGTDCGSVSVAFVSPPPALLVVGPLSWLGPDTAVLAFRVLGAAALAGGMYVLWRRLSYRSPHAGLVLVGTVLALTPFVVSTVSLGQNSPLLFLSAVVGLGARRTRWRWVGAIAALFALTVVFKLFPIVLVAVLVWQRRWRMVAAVAVILATVTAMTLVLVPTRLFAQFADVTRVFNGFAPTNPYNGALVALVRPVAEGFVASGAGGATLFVVGAAIAAAGWWFLVRPCRDDDAQWAWCWLLVLFLVPMVWPHYLWVAVAAFGAALAARAQVDDRRLASLLVLGLATVPSSVFLSAGAPQPVWQAVVLVGSVVAGWWLVPRSPGDRHAVPAPG